MGALLLLAAGGVAAVAGSGRGGITGALLLLGVGWNAGLIGGSALLRAAPVSPSLRTRAEGLGELGMGIAAAAGGGGAGLLLATGGLALLGLVAAAPCLLVLAAVATAGRRHPGGVADARAASRADAHPVRPEEDPRFLLRREGGTGAAAIVHPDLGILPERVEMATCWNYRA